MRKNKVGCGKVTRTKISYENIELVVYPSGKYISIKERLIELYKICEPEEGVFQPFINPSKLVIGYNNFGLQSFMVVTTTKNIYEQFPKGFEDSGGRIGKSGLFITSVCGNVIEYYGILNGLFEKLFDYSRSHRVEYLLLHVSVCRPKIKKKYETYGFQVTGKIKQNEEDFYVMTKEINP